MVGSGKPSGGIQGIFMVSPTDTTTFCGTAFHFFPKTKRKLWKNGYLEKNLHFRDISAGSDSIWPKALSALHVYVPVWSWPKVISIRSSPSW